MIKTSIATLCLFLCCALCLKAQQLPGGAKELVYPFDKMPEVLPGTQALTWGLAPAAMSARLLNGAHAFIDEKIKDSERRRQVYWQRNFSSHAAYIRSVDPNRKRFMEYMGVAEKGKGEYQVGLTSYQAPVLMQKLSVNNDTELVAETAGYRVYQVRWPVHQHVYGEGLLLQPKQQAKANIIALPDADQTPEQLVGLQAGVAPESQFARRLAENGFQVLVPVLISRAVAFPGKPQQQTYREWVYRQAFHMGRHLIGYEVEKVMAAIDWFKQSPDQDARIGVAGYAEGGLIAFYAAAVDKRIDAVLVSGYFNSRQQVWEEPIYRNVWGLLTEFGDAEIAALIAPRPLVVEHSALPEALERATAKPQELDLFSYSGYKGSLQTPEFATVEEEFNRIDRISRPGFQNRYLVSAPGRKPASFGSAPALERFTLSLGHKMPLPLSEELPADRRQAFNPEARQLQQVRELEEQVQELMRDSDEERNNYFLYQIMPEFADRKWSTRLYHPYFAPDRMIAGAKKYRQYFAGEVLGRFEEPYLPPNPMSRRIYDKEKFTGYEVVLDVYNNLQAAGVLLLPKDLKPGEKRPVVVCQHGRNGVPQHLVEGSTSYNDVAARLAEQGFIVFAHYGLFSGEDRYRWLDRKANTLKKTLFSFMLSQHDQTLRWLGSLPFVDKNRIAFYGKSYGGETAMRLPAVLEGYSLSICSGDFGDWTRKVADTHYPNSFMHTIEWEMPYFNMGSTFSYAEMAYLIFPRPFMVERGHHDLVQPASWVAYEYGKVKFFYDQFNMGDKTAIEYFNGGHATRGDGIFEFLHKHLNWP